jgi:hypothetical protein
MAKSVIEAVSHRATQADKQTTTGHATVVCGVLGFKKTYSPDEWEQIEAERSAMRERLLAQG